MGGRFEVSMNPLFNFMALPGFETLGEDLVFYGNPALSETMMFALKTIGGGLEVSHNKVLMDLNLSGLNSVGNHVEIHHNYAMSECYIDVLLAQIENKDGIGGEIDVYENGENCP